MDRFEISNLRVVYGDVLTEKQNEMLRLHFDEDLSFGEIADIYGVSRQAVAGAIKVGENTLVDYENKLSIVKRENAINENLTAALKSIENGDINSAKQKIADTLKLLEE